MFHIIIIYIEREIYDSGRQQGEDVHVDLAKDVVLELSEPYYGTGRDIYMDRFFTSHSLAIELLRQNLTLVGTTSARRRHVPPAIKSTKRRPVESSKFLYDHENKIILMSYVPKKNKNVIMMSSSHSAPSIHENTKPTIIMDYNKSKIRSRSARSKRRGVQLPSEDPTVANGNQLQYA